MSRDRASIVVAVIMLVAPIASAETVLTGFAGVALGGATEKSHGTYGGSLGFLGRAAGFEVDFASTPDFFGDAPSGGLFTRNNVVTLMGNLLVVVPSGPVRVYGAVGAGLLRTRLEDADRIFDVNGNDFGFDVGGGLIGYVGSTVGLRADVRYFRNVSDLDEGLANLGLGRIDYWRLVGGLSLRF